MPRPTARATVLIVVYLVRGAAAADPPRLVKSQRRNLVYTYLTYEHLPDETMRASGMPARPYRFRVRLPMGISKAADIRKPAPLLVSLHGRRGDYKRRETRWPDHLVLFPDDSMVGPFGTAWFGYHNRFPNPPGVDAVVEPYTVRRVVYYIRFVSQNFNVDRAAVWARGRSLGGAGALTLAVMHPELIAGAWAALGPVDVRASPALQLMVAPVWGRFDEQLKVAGTEATVWEHQSLAWQLCRDSRQVGWLHLEAGKADRVVPFAEYTEPYDPPGRNVFEAFEAGRVAGSIIWDQRGHGKKDPWGVWFPRFDPLGHGLVRLDRSYPAFSNASTGPMSPVRRKGGWIEHADPRQRDRGMVNPFFRWDAAKIVDRPDRYEIRLWLDEGCPVETIQADVTIRNLQRLAVPRGGRLRWQVRPQGRDGQLEVGRDGLVTVPNLAIPRGRANSARLILTHPPDAPVIVIDSRTHPDRVPRVGNKVEFTWRWLRSEQRAPTVATKLTSGYDDWPGRADVTTKTSAVFKQVEAGSYYFHVRLRLGKRWGPVFSKQIYVDQAVAGPAK